ncbi:MAG: hypothetical protein Q9162_007777 [Coniocarpon cinnabarinum]
MSQHLSEICALLVRHLICKTLLEHDRLQLRHLVRIAGISPRHTKHGLAVLINHRLVSFHPPGPVDETYYEADKLQIYNLVRLGRSSELVYNRYGAPAADILQVSQCFGLATASQLVDEAKNSTQANQSEGADLGNDCRTSLAPSVDDFQTQVKQLCERHFLEAVTDLSFMSAVDLDLAAADWVRIHDARFAKGTSGPKKSSDFRDAVEAKKLKLKRGVESLESPSPSEDASALAGERDSPEEEDKPRKRRKTSKEAIAVADHREENARPVEKHRDSRPDAKVSGSSSAKVDCLKNSTSASSSPEEGMAYLHVNNLRVAQALRSNLLAEFAKRRLGEMVGWVYGALLQVLEEASVGDPSLIKDDVREFQNATADTSQVVGALDCTITNAILNDIEARDEFARKESLKVEDDAEHEHPKTQGPSKSSKHHKKQPINGLRSNKHRPEEKNEILRKAVNTQLHILADDPHEFVNYDKHFQKWSVDQKRLIDIMIQLEIERTINARFGPTATRMTRILHEKGNLEEKQIGQFGLVQQKELRTVLATMQEAGFVDVQEVPRDNARQPSRNIYLWTYDQGRTCSIVLERVYKTMSRLLQRYNYEQEIVTSAREKRQRTYIPERQESVLEPYEEAALAAWDAKEEKTLLQLSRLDELVLLFRDCADPGDL